jgi:hypothetical protein
MPVSVHQLSFVEMLGSGRLGPWLGPGLPPISPRRQVAGLLNCREPNRRPSRSRIFGAGCGGPAGGPPLLPLLNVGAYSHCEECTKTSVREPDGPESAAIRSCQELVRSVVFWPATTDQTESSRFRFQPNGSESMAKKTAEFRAADSVCVVSNRAAGSNPWGVCSILPTDEPLTPQQVTSREILSHFRSHGTGSPPEATPTGSTNADGPFRCTSCRPRLR